MRKRLFILLLFIILPKCNKNTIDFCNECCFAKVVDLTGCLSSRCHSFHARLDVEEHGINPPSVFESNGKNYDVGYPFKFSRKAFKDTNIKGAAEGWPFGRCFYDANNDLICVCVTEAEGHIDSPNVGAAYFKCKHPFEEWSEFYKIADNADGVGKRVHSANILPDGSYIAIVCHKQASGSVDGTMHVYRSSDNGITWTDNGAIKIDGTDLQGDIMCPLYVASGGRLLSAINRGSKIGTANHFYMYSDDNGKTWNRANGLQIHHFEPEFVTIENTIFAVCRSKTDDYPVLYYSDDNGSSWTKGGYFMLRSFSSPISITKMDGRFLVVCADRIPNKTGHFEVKVAFLNETYFPKTGNSKEIKASVVCQSIAVHDNNNACGDFGYVHTVCTDKGQLFCYYYDRTPAHENGGETAWFELVGNVLFDNK